ncbi:hypothetical protein A1F94_013021 [Pyrenophora tritici-repentis]|nr:hypothetical protein A1F94_013861 [Pyrenophora tritici-repentis]KAG9376474.1 hypothetical protein A1F94_013021 [Pyrenophora tritici-repentis]
MSNPNLDQSSLFLLVQQLQQEVQNQRVEIQSPDLILTHRAPAYISLSSSSDPPLLRPVPAFLIHLVLTESRLHSGHGSLQSAPSFDQTSSQELMHLIMYGTA